MPGATPATKDAAEAQRKREQAIAALFGTDEGCVVAKAAPRKPRPRQPANVGGSGGGGKNRSTTTTRAKAKPRPKKSSNAIPAYDPPEWDAILTAAFKNDAQKIRHLVEVEGVPPNHSNAVDQTGLHLAALWGHVEALQAFLKYKFLLDVNAQNKMSGGTPLHMIMMNGKGTTPNLLKCMDILLKNGADPNKKDFWGKTPADYYNGDPNTRVLAIKLKPQPMIFQAIDCGDIGGVQRILSDEEYKRRPFEELYAGKTSFIYTLDLILEDTEEPKEPNFLLGLVEIVKLIFEEATENSNSSFLMEYCTGGGGGKDKPPLLRVCTALQDLYEKKSDGNNDNKDVEIQALESLCRLLGPYWPPTDKKLVQLFHTACRKNDLKMVKVYMEVIEMDPNIEGQSGMTALHFAARSGCATVIRYLLEQEDIDVTVTDNLGKTPMDAARANKKEEALALLEEFSRQNIRPGE